MDNRGLAGAFMFVGGLQFTLGMVLAEILYPAIFLGIFILLSSYCLWLEFKDYLISILIGLSGLGAFGVELFPETTGILHFLGDRVWGIFDVVR